MSSHNPKKRKRSEVNKPQVIVNLEEQSIGHLESDISPTVATSSNDSVHRVSVPGANKRFCDNTNGILGKRSEPKIDGTVNKIRNHGTPEDAEDAATKSCTEALKMALARINELQDELQDLSDEYDESDNGTSSWPGETPELLGYAVCVQETLAFLASQGLDGDNPMIVNLKNSLVEAMPL